MERTYIAIDLKSFYASVECVERGLDPLTTNLVVADASRTEKTICLAVAPALKQYGIGGRARLFEVVQAVKRINAERLSKAPYHRFKGKSSSDIELKANPALELDYIIATPQMKHYMQRSAEIYKIYLSYISSSDIHVYSIDEVFMDVTDYLFAYHCSAHDLAMRMIQDVLKATGITATAGIGSNLYLAKVAMDIVAKHMPADKDGVRIAELDEMSYRKLLWEHEPLKDFWRIGEGIRERLEKHGLYTQGDIARFSIKNEDVLYKEFGVNAELIIDHAWGYEPTTIKDIKAYKPSANSISTGQVLSCAYDYEKGRLIVKEMADLLALDLVRKGLSTDELSLAIGHDKEDLNGFSGEVKEDYYGRLMPKGTHGSIKLGRYTSSSEIFVKKIGELYDRIMNPKLHVKRVYVVAVRVMPETFAEPSSSEAEQLSLFEEVALEAKAEPSKKKEELIEENKLQKTILKIQGMYGKNSVLKGMNLEEGAKTIDRNLQVGGHKA